MAIQQLHTYCAMCVSRCGVLATVEDGILTEGERRSRAPERLYLRQGDGRPRDRLLA